MTAIRAIVGTAGHIDHGKSALVRALTGIEPDRLPEERKRGISIELGFAHLDVEGLGRVGVVDVPGHERFIRQMLAGAHGFDLVLIVVAADDGVMPQTEEHFDIVHLLGVPRAMFVITKTDAAGPARIEEVRGEIEILAVGTRFENAPVVAVSARSGEGLDDLRARLAAELAGLEARPTDGRLRIPIDRVFLVKGHGLVVTGTALAGRVRVGDEVAILPDRERVVAGRLARVRELQVHGETVEEALAGQRVALNLTGVDFHDVERGETVAAASDAGATLRLDARIEVRPAAGRALASHSRVRVHHGTRETSGRLVWLGGEKEVAPRHSAYAQLTLAHPLVAAAGDAFVLRDETAQRTLGGGVILLARAARHRPSRGDVAASLATIEEGEAGQRLHAILVMAGGGGLAPADAAVALGLTVQSLLALAAGDRGIAVLGERSSPQLLLTSERLEAVLAGLVAAVGDFHAKNPNLPGIDLEHLRGSSRPVPEARIFRLFLENLLARGEVVRRGNLVHAKGHAASLATADESLAARILARVVAGAAMPPTTKDLASEFGVEPGRLLKVAAVLVVRGDLVKVAPDLFFAREAIDDIRARVVDFLGREGEITAAGFRDLIAASRKYGIPLLDWLDRQGVTLRVGDVRKLRRV